MKYILVTVLLLFTVNSLSQKAIIPFETNGKTQPNIVKNPFKKFIGEWTLKENKWIQNWGYSTETIVIPKHHTISTQINTKNSLFSIIDGPEPNGHIFWSFNPKSKKVQHLSSFGEFRSGVGEGSISENGDLTLQITFEGEPKDTYRIYKYRWITKDEYHMKSVQYTFDGRPTGLFYEGTFVRFEKEDTTTLETQIKEILAVLDNSKISIEEQLKVYTENIVHMAPGHEVNLGKKKLSTYLKGLRQNGKTSMKHEIVEVNQYGSVVIMRGKVRGTYYPKNRAVPIEFRTKNLFVFDLKEGVLKIKKVIYNSSPNK